MIRSFFSRIGCLLLTAGMIILAVEFVAMQSRHSASSWLAVGGAAAFVGFLLWARLRERAPRSTRSSLLRKRERREEQDRDHDWEGHFYD